jgi:hypothetical protein
MTKRIDFRLFCVATVALAVAAAATTRSLGVPLLPALLVVLGAALANGLIAGVSDQRPRELDEPTRAEVSRRSSRGVTVARCVLAILVGGLGLVSAAAATSGSGALQLYAISAAATCVLLVLALGVGSRRLLWMAAVVLVVGLSLSVALRSW